MFKVIKDFVPQTTFMMLCDRSCGTYSTVAIPPENADMPEKLDAFQAIWAQQLQSQGWRITLAEQVCPAHIKQDVEGKSLIEIPQMSNLSRKC